MLKTEISCSIGAPLGFFFLVLFGRPFVFLSSAITKSSSWESDKDFLNTIDDELSSCKLEDDSTSTFSSAEISVDINICVILSINTHKNVFRNLFYLQKNFFITSIKN